MLSEPASYGLRKKKPKQQQTKKPRAVKPVFPVASVTNCNLFEINEA